MSQGKGERKSRWARASAMSVLLATDEGGRWHPGIGDPTLVGWVTVAGYFVAAGFCFAAARAARALASKLSKASPEQARDERSLARLWGISTLAMVLLGINKQLDLQTWFTETLRDLSREQGWYENRRIYQVLFIALIGLAGVLVTSSLAYSLRRVFSRARGTIIGLALISCFVVIRAASMHHVDALLGVRFGHLKINAILELSGILVVALAARRGLLRYRSTPKA